LFPSDAVSSEKAVEIAANYKGMVYIKGGRNNHPVFNKIFNLDFI